jgi:hypothetical protein
MLFVSLIRWWYGAGWVDQLKLVRGRFDRTADLFSLELSLRTMFKPFKQIDADGARKGSLDVVLRAMFDQLFSRFFGAVVRSGLIVAGSIALFLELMLGSARLAVWPLMPVMPLIGLVLASSGWLPWR